MTTIVGDADRRVLVADTLFSDDETKWYGDKVHQVPGGLFGAAGTFSDAVQVLAHLRDGGPLPVYVDNNAFLLLTAEGLFSADNNLAWEPVVGRMAIGTGVHAAESMLRSGHSAEAAVRMAIDVDAKSGGKAKTYRLRRSKR